MNENETIKKDEMELDLICEKCDGTGITWVVNGPDDADQDFCTCDVGEHARHISENEIIHHAN